MTRRRELMAAALLAAPAALCLAGAPEPAIVAAIRQRMADAPVLRGQFEQRKTVRGFRNPLVSRGDFLVARERGVVWRTREPFASTLSVTRDRLLTRQADGTVVTKLSARDEPGLRAINETLFALMATDLQALSQRFRLEGELLGNQAWRLTLVPREPALAQWVSRIELEGNRFLGSVRLTEAQGDLSVIQFSQQAGSTALTRQEEADFD